MQVGGVEVESARPPLSVTVTLSDALDVSRGDLICHSASRPAARRELDAMICWMSEAGRLEAGRRLGIKHTTRTARAVVDSVVHRLDVNSLRPEPGVEALALNDIGRVRLRCTTPLFPDAYARNRVTGSFILIDEATSNTVAAGMVLADAS